MKKSKILLASFLIALVFSAFSQQKGYYRFPTLHNNTVVYTAEGDLCKFDQTTGISARLTTHHGVESNATISPDGKWIAYNAEYEGPNEVYILPLTGGIPKRITVEGMSGRSTPKVFAWKNDNELIVSTSYYSTLPSAQLVLIDINTLEYNRIQLAQADEGVYDSEGNLYFTRLPHQSSHTKRYKGGTVQNLWKFDGENEATPLTADYAGTSYNPMF